MSDASHRRQILDAAVAYRQKASQVNISEHAHFPTSHHSRGATLRPGVTTPPGCIRKGCPNDRRGRVGCPFVCPFTFVLSVAAHCRTSCLRIRRVRNPSDLCPAAILCLPATAPSSDTAPRGGTVPEPPITSDAPPSMLPSNHGVVFIYAGSLDDAYHIASKALTPAHLVRLSDSREPLPPTSADGLSHPCPIHA